MFHVERLGLVPYNRAWELQKNIALDIDQGTGPNRLLLLEHPHTITLGRGSNHSNLLLSQEYLDEIGIELVEIDRGGDITYHGPGQVIGYPIFYFSRESGIGPHEYLRLLEQLLIEVLDSFGVSADRKAGYTGVWVNNHKIAAIGVKFNRARNRRGYITTHGFALNVSTDLSYFSMIVPCGIAGCKITSLEQHLGKKIEIEHVLDRIAKILSTMPDFSKISDREVPVF